MPLVPYFPNQEHEEQDALACIDNLLVATERAIENQKKLKTLIIEYKEVEKKAIARPDDIDAVSKLVFQAKKVYEAIAVSHLEHYFPQRFLQELEQLSQVADKNNIPSPK